MTDETKHPYEWAIELLADLCCIRSGGPCWNLHLDRSEWCAGCIARQAIGEADTVDWLLKKERDELRAECGRLRRALAPLANAAGAGFFPEMDDEVAKGIYLWKPGETGCDPPGISLVDARRARDVLHNRAAIEGWSEKDAKRNARIERLEAELDDTNRAFAFIKEVLIRSLNRANRRLEQNRELEAERDQLCDHLCTAIYWLGMTLDHISGELVMSDDDLETAWEQVGVEPTVKCAECEKLKEALTWIEQHVEGLYEGAEYHDFGPILERCRTARGEGEKNDGR